MKFVPSALLLLFAVSFFGTWFVIGRTCRYLLKLGVSFSLFAAALVIQGIPWLANMGTTLLLPGMCYTQGMLLFADGILTRSDRKLPFWHAILWLVGIVSLLMYFFYVNPSLSTRVIILNLGVGGIFLTLLWNARFLRSGSKADRVLFWILVIFMAHYIVRSGLTIHTISAEQITDINSLGQSLFWRWIQISSAVIGASLGAGLLVIMAMDTMAALKHERNFDVLTGLLNRRGLEQRLPALLEQYQTSEVRVVACDIDNFKKINDVYGHSTGDAILAHIAKTISAAITKPDICARVGGEDFVIVLCDRSAAEAFEFTEQLRTTIQTMKFENLSLVRSVTCSFGIARLNSHDNFWRTVAKVDAILYAAKKAGRNQTFTEEHQVPGAA